MYIDPLGLAPGDVPGWLDWDGDGYVDTDLDKKSFDADSNRVADWYDAGYDNIDDWFANRTAYTLSDFPYVFQGYDNNLCWAAVISMVTEWFTETPKDFVEIAKDRFGEDYNHGSNPSGIIETITENGYLKGTGYKIASQQFNVGDNKGQLNFDMIKSSIDHNMPVIWSVPSHIVTIIGYDNSDNNEIIIYYDSSYSKEYRTIKFSQYKHRPVVFFEREW